MPWQTAPVMVIMVGAFTVSGLMMPAFQRLINGGKVTSHSYFSNYHSHHKKNLKDSNLDYANLLSF